MTYIKGNFMKNERILSYKLSQKIAEEDLQDISAAGMTRRGTDSPTHAPHGGADIEFDMSYD
jgi:hypothetical protein